MREQITFFTAGDGGDQNQLLKRIDPDLRSRILPFLIPPNLVQHGSQIGSGHFGIVYKGTLYNDQLGVYKSVAIKGFSSE